MFRTSGPCQSIRHVVLYENRESRRSRAVGELIISRANGSSTACAGGSGIGKASGSGSGRRDFVTASTDSDVRFDPYDVELIADPYPMFKRLRDEAPLYYNAEYDFYALSRFADVNKGIVDHGTYSSARGVIMELIKANLEIPSGMLIFEDPPIHDGHRKP